MLDVQNMFEEDKLFNFMLGQKGWELMELHQQNMWDLQSVIVVTNELGFARISSLDMIRWLGKIKAKPKKIRTTRKNGKNKNAQRGNKGKGKLKVDWKVVSKFKESSKSTQGCFICNRPHHAQHCPRKEKLNALLFEESST